MRVPNFMPACRRYYGYAALGVALLAYLVVNGSIRVDGLASWAILVASFTAVYAAGVHAAEIDPEDLKEQGWTPPEDDQEDLVDGHDGDPLSLTQAQQKILNEAYAEADYNDAMVPRSGDADYEDWVRHVLRSAGETHIVRDGKRVEV